MIIEVLCVQAVLIFFNYFFYPIDTIRRWLMMQIGWNEKDIEYRGFFNTFKTMY